MGKDLKEIVGKLFCRLRGKNRLFDVVVGTRITERHLYQIEKGANITLDTLQKLCDYHNLDIQFVDRDTGEIVESCHLHKKKPRRRR